MAVAGLGALHPALPGTNGAPYPDDLHREDTPSAPWGPGTTGNTHQKALGRGVCALRRSKCACVTTCVGVRCGVCGCECECGSPVCPCYLSGSLFGSQGEWGSWVGSGPGNTGLLPPRPWAVHKMGHQDTAVRSPGYGTEVGTSVPSCDAFPPGHLPVPKPNKSVCKQGDPPIVVNPSPSSPALAPAPLP